MRFPSHHVPDPSRVASSTHAIGAEPTPRHILIVEDDARIASLLGRYLQGEGYTTSVLVNGLLVEPEVRLHEPSLVLLDLLLPGRDGIDVCRDLRRFSAVPIIIVSAHCEERSRLAGLEGGADDYVCKPFSPRELSARIEAVIRRAEGRLANIAPAHGFRIDDGAQRISWEGRWLPLTPLEFRLFAKLLSRPGHVFSRNDLLEGVQERYRQTTDRAVDSHIKNLRKKIASVRHEGSAIVSVYGSGYRFDPEAQDEI
jgi:two-component system response regulator BaeR